MARGLPADIGGDAREIAGPAPAGPWLNLWRVLTHVDRGKILPGRALRNTSGVLGPGRNPRET